MKTSIYYSEAIALKITQCEKLLKLQSLTEEEREIVELRIKELKN